MRLLAAGRDYLAIVLLIVLTACGGGSDAPSAPPTPPPPPPPQAATISASATSLTFSSTAGGANPAAQTVSITNTGGGTLNWTATSSAPWVSVTPSSGTAPSTLTITTIIGGLGVGSHNGSISISASGATNSPVTITLRLDLAAPRLVDPGLWTGVTSQGRSINFRASSSGLIDELAVRIDAALSNGTCTAVFGGSSAGVQVANSAMADSVSHPAISLSRRIPVTGTFGATSKVTGNIGGYSGSFSVICGSSFVFGTGTLWSAMTFEARAMATVENSVAFSSLIAGEFHACGLTASGAAYCWGQNQFGQLGNGTTTPITNPTPLPVTGGLTFVKLSGNGRTNTCGITTAGTTWCWGSGSNGRLGNGTTTDSPVPTQVSGGLTFTQITTGLTHSCALTADGSAYCWGYNINGQLGDSSTINRTAPVAVKTSLKFTAITAGRDYFTCGIAVGGDAYCWGAVPNSTSTTGPILVTGGVKFTSIDAGQSHICGVTTTQAAYCWGRNFDGQIGDNSQTPRSVPTLVSGGLQFQAVDSGDDHSCGRTQAGLVYCWGSNVGGALGTGTLVARSLVPVEIFGGLTFSSLAVGENFACGLSSRSVAFCWGSNFAGRLGIGASSNSVAEVPVAVHPRN